MEGENRNSKTYTFRETVLLQDSQKCKHFYKSCQGASPPWILVAQTNVQKSRTFVCAQENLPMNQRRQNYATFRLSDEERQILQERIKDSGLSSQEFLLRSSIGKPIMNAELFQSLLIELRKIGTNINQMARACNSGHQEDVAESAIVAFKKIEKTVQALRTYYELDSQNVDLSKLKKLCELVSDDLEMRDNEVLKEILEIWQYLKL